MSDWQFWAELRETSRDFLGPWEPTWPRDALTKAAFRRRLDHVRQEWEQETGYGFLAFRTTDETLLGGVTLSNVRRGVALTASLGYWIGAPYARQGYMSEALLTVLHFAFDQLGLHRVEAACLEKNEASRRLLQKSGFRPVGYARQYLKIDGRWQDHLLFEILCNDPRDGKTTSSDA
jgi:ribosomal-protein-alanine N-acetyltransferase